MVLSVKLVLIFNMSHTEEKGGEEAGELKYCAVREDDAYAYVNTMGLGDYVCYDCYDTWLSNSYVNNSEETKCPSV